MTAQDGGDRISQTNSDSRYWYAITAFVVSTIVSVVYVSFTGTVIDRATDGEAFLSLWLFGLLILAVLVYPALFLDAVYVRRLDLSWQPKSWYYIAGVFSTTVIVFVIMSVLYQNTWTLLLGIGVFVGLTFAVCTRYLYRRHQFLGEP